MRNVQHKKEAYWFYRVLSIFYDKYVNPFFWTEGMRNEALALGDFNSRELTVADVGSGTGFTTQGISKYVDASNISCLDQSPHQMAYAKARPELQQSHFQVGDAEDLPFETDHFDRYVSAGSIEYWPEPLRGIAESYRIIKPDGKALMIGPLRPRNWFARLMADTWMLFPEEEEYIKWYEEAGFVDIKKVNTAPKWVFKEKYAVALVGTKPKSGDSPANLPEKKIEDVAAKMTFNRRISFVWHLLIGNLAGFMFIPMAVVGYANYGLRKLFGRIPEKKKAVLNDRLTVHQRVSLATIVLMAVAAAWLAMAA
ncbi:MAG: methyltransferase domain-containing protein [Calditrichia bacterium]